MEDENTKIALIIKETSKSEKILLLEWLDEIAAIKNSSLSKTQKLKKIALSLKKTKSLLPLISRIKPLFWDSRSKTFKVTMGVAIVTATLIPGNVGLASAGFGIGLPIWLLSAIGYNFVAHLSKELKRSISDNQDGVIDASYTVINSEKDE